MEACMRTREYYFRFKIFSKQDIEKIGNIFIEEYEKTKQTESYVEFFVRFDDHTTLEHHQLEMILREFDYRKPVEISFIYKSISNGRRISLWLEHTTEIDDENELKISSDEDEWLNSCFFRFKEVLDGIESRDNYWVRHPKITQLGLVYVMSVPCLILLTFLRKWIKQLGYTKEFPMSMSLIIGMVFYGGILYSLNKFMEFFPYTELKIGPEHKQLSKKRVIVATIAGAYMFPILLLIIQEVLIK